MAPKLADDETCSIARTVAIIGDPWMLMILRDAFRGVRRFEQLQESLGISPAVLTDRLRRLVDAGILIRQPYADTQRTRHEYRLTEDGFDLYPVMQSLRAWGDAHLEPHGPLTVYAHRGCTGHAQIALRCSDCGQPLTARDVRPSAA